MNTQSKDREELLEQLSNTKTFNYNVYLAESARLSKDCLSVEEAVEEIMQLIDSYTAEQVRLVNERNWWITDRVGDKSVKIAGPFTTNADAAFARQYLEKINAPKTFWIEQLKREGEKE